jgi:hypothetical protein
MPIRRILVREADLESGLSDFERLARSAHPGNTCHLILGFDIEKLREQAGPIEEWLHHFSDFCKRFDPHVFAGTVFLLVGRNRDPSRPDDPDIDRLVDAGACLREKGEEYDAYGVDLATALRSDLIAANLISPVEFEELEEATEFRGPVLSKTETEAIIQYYIDPPFKWSGESIEQLLGDRSKDTTIRLPR